MQLTEPDQLPHESYSAGWQTNGRADARIRQGTLVLRSLTQWATALIHASQHMNLVLADTEEFRRTRRRGKAAPGATQQVTETEERRAIGLTIIRGAHVISLSVDGPPPADPAARLGASAGGPSTAAALAAGPGVARPAGRGLPVGLTGPAPGVGGPGPGFGGGFPGAPGGFGGPPGFPGRGGPPGGPRTFPLSIS